MSCLCADAGGVHPGFRLDGGPLRRANGSASAVAVFTVASVLCAVATGVTELHAGAHPSGRRRRDDGAGRPARRPQQHVEGRPDAGDRDADHRPALSAPILGPPLGGFITTYASWHWIFILNVPLGIVAFALTFWLIPNDRRDDRPAVSTDRLPAHGLLAPSPRGLDIRARTGSAEQMPKGVRGPSITLGQSCSSVGRLAPFRPPIRIRCLDLAGCRHPAPSRRDDEGRPRCSGTAVSGGAIPAAAVASARLRARPCSRPASMCWRSSPAISA